LPSTTSRYWENFPGTRYLGKDSNENLFGNVVPAEPGRIE
jgi:hypothetical protein